MSQPDPATYGDRLRANAPIADPDAFCVLLERLIGSNVPAAVPVVGPRITDVAAFEAPLQPSQLVMGKMLEQLDRRPARRQPAQNLGLATTGTTVYGSHRCVRGRASTGSD